jgi:hypothetical protein
MVTARSFSPYCFSRFFFGGNHEPYHLGYFDLRECAAAATVDSAADMLMGLGANTPIECLMSSQALIAQSALLPADKAANHYLKVVCIQSRDVAKLRVDPSVNAHDVLTDNDDFYDEGPFSRRTP